MCHAKERIYKSQEAERDRYIVGQLLIPHDVLAMHPFEIEKNASEEGLVYSWIICWLNSPPPGGEAPGGVTHIAPDHSDHIDWPDDL